MLKRSVVLRANKIKPLKNVVPDHKSAVLFTLFLCGLVIGVTLVNKSSDSLLEFFFEILRNNILTKTQTGWFKCFCFEFIWLFIPVFFCFISGLCGVGLPFIWSVPLLFGLISGMAFSVLFIKYGITGLGYCALIYIPSCALTTADLIKCCCKSSQMSGDIFLYILSAGNKDNNKKSMLKEYGASYILFCIPIIIAAVLNVCGFKLFSGLFGLV